MSAKNPFRGPSPEDLPACECGSSRVRVWFTADGRTTVEHVCDAEEVDDE